MISRRPFLGLMLAGMAAPRMANAATLDSASQLDRERAILRLLARPEVKAAIRRVEALYAADPQAGTPAGAARLTLAAHSIGVSAINYALGEDATRAEVIWNVNAPHRWHGMAVPGSGFGIDNPDNIYMNFTVDGAARYRLHGQVPNPGPVQLHMEVRDSIPGMGEMLVEGGQMLATLQTEQMHIGPDGRFAVTLDSDPAGGRINHMAIPGDGSYIVGVRQLLTDWSRQRPIALRLERLEPKARPARRDYARLARRSAEILDRIAPYWMDYNNRFLFSREPNRFAPARLRPGGRGISTSCHYALARDEAFVITVDALGAISLGCQITDPWGVAYEYDVRTSSLNQVQARPDAAGTFTFVISARDPGFANWLDSGGHSSGISVLRWQGLPAGADPARAIRLERVAKLSDLAAVLPPGQGQLSPAGRVAQRKARARDYAVRLRY